MPHNYVNICFEGGGAHGLCYIGAIAKLELLGVRTSLRRYAGASIGTLMALMCALHVPADEMFCRSHQLTERTLVGWRNPLAMAVRVVRHWGVYDLRESFSAWIAQLLVDYTRDGNAQLTFQQLYDEYNGSELFLAVFNVSKWRSEIFSRDTHPDCPIVDVVTAAMSFPLMFTPQPINGSTDLYIDAGIVNNLPLHVFDPVDPHRVVTLALRTVSTASVLFAEKSRAAPGPTSLFAYIHGMGAMMLESAQQRYERPIDAQCTCFIRIDPNIPSLDLSIGPVTRQALFTLGSCALGEFIQTTHDDNEEITHLICPATIRSPH